MRLHRTLAPALLLVLASPVALALRLDYSVELGYLHSDNINLSATDPVDENLLIPRVGFRLSETGSAVRAEVNGLLEYRDYLGGAFGNEFRSTLDGIVDWTLIPERMKWTFTDALGLNPINLRLPDTPGNLQQTNVFATGPTFQFRLASNVTGLAELRYTDSYAEESSDFNSNRFSGALRGLFELDSTRRLSANIEAADINYDSNSAQSDYKRYAGYAGYVQKLSALELDAAAGEACPKLIKPPLVCDHRDLRAEFQRLFRQLRNVAAGRKGDNLKPLRSRIGMAHHGQRGRADGAGRPHDGNPSARRHDCSPSCAGSP